MPPRVTRLAHRAHHAHRGSMADDKAPRVIKRYANRKLYDMSESCYIT
ncbi:MAG: fatty acid desaturase, partial [Myxococcota bacterium]